MSNLHSRLNNLSDGFKLEGVWYPPSRDDLASKGSLEFTQNSGANLVIESTKDDLHEFYISQKIFWGISTESKKITTKEYFERYFVCTVPLLDIPDKEIDEFILNSKDFSPKEIYAKVTEFVTAAGVPSFMSKLAHRIHVLSINDKLPDKSLVTLAVASSRLGNFVSESERVYHNSTADIWFSLLKLISSNADRFDVARNVAQEVEPITFIFECFKTVCASNHKKSEIPFSKEEQSQLCGIIVDRIKQVGGRAPIYIEYPKYAPFFLKTWSQLATRKETDEYLEKTLEGNPRNVFSLIKSCLLDGNELQGLPDASLEIHTLNDCGLIISVVDAEVVRSVLRKILLIRTIETILFV